MRMVSFVAPTSKQAMADLRAGLGEDAIILTIRTLDDSQVSVTGAVADDAFDLGDLLVSSEETRSLDWLKALVDFHEWPLKERVRIEAILEEIVPAEPESVLKALVRALFHFDTLHFQCQKPVIFSGPPGSGKTVTIAKLAAARVVAGDAVDVVTTDIDRAGSLDQLNTLLAPLDLAPIPVSTLSELPDMLSACKGDAVLVDTAGINPFNPTDLANVSTMVTRTSAQLMPVLSAGQGYADSVEIARSYVALGANAMVVTKLDVANRLGGLLGAAEAGLAFTEVGIGPTIGEGLCALSADGMARLLLRRYRSSICEETDR